MILRHLLLLSAICLIQNVLVAQAYDHSKGFSKSPKASDQQILISTLSKEKAPVHAELSRKQQQLLQTFYDDRAKVIGDLLASKQLIDSGPLYDYVNSIFTKILHSNPEIPSGSRLFLVNDAVTNAYTLGNDLIFVNTGLVYSMRSADELAFVISHELAHNSFQHSENNIYRKVLMMTDTEMNDQISKASRQQYQSVSALNQLLVPVLLEEKELSRKAEIASDSLGAKFLINSGFKPSGALGCFEKLHRTEEFSSEPTADINALLKIPETSTLHRKASTYRESNSLGVFVDTNEFTSYLRSHPYGKQRREIIAARFAVTSADTLEDTVYNSYRYLANGEIVAASIARKNLSEAFFYSLRMKNDFPQDQFSQLEIAFIAGELAFLKKQRKSGKYLDLQSSKQEKAYDRIVWFLQSVNPAECQELSEIAMAGVQAPENCVSAICTRAVWAFNKEQYEDYSLKADVARGFATDTEYMDYLIEMNEYFIISGKAKTTNK